MGLSAASLLIPGLLTAVSGAEARADRSPEKTRGLTIEQLKDIIERDMKAQYFITGDLTREVYDEQCRFTDPANDTTGVEKYLKAVNILFDPAASSLDLLSIDVTGPNTVKTTWQLQGVLKFPWRPKVGPVEGSTVYTTDDNHLIVSHAEKWDISPVTALVQSFSPF